MVLLYFFLLCLFCYIPSFKVIINTSQNNVWRNSRVNTYCPCPIKLRPNVKKCHSKQRDQVDLEIDSKQIYLNHDNCNQRQRIGNLTGLCHLRSRLENIDRLLLSCIKINVL